MKHLLYQYDWFKMLSPGDIASIAARSKLKDYGKGDYLCHEGETASSLFLIHTGKVKLVQHTILGRDVLLDIATAGELIMLEPLFNGSEYPVSAVATEPVNVIQVEKRAFRLLLDKYPELTKKCLQELAQRLTNLTTQISELTIGKVDYRIANMILKLGDKLGQPDLKGRVRLDVALSRQDIADFTGTTIETAIRTMSRLVKAKVVESTKDSITILDVDKLEDIAMGA